MAALRNSFGDVIISKPLWPAHSHDLMLCVLTLKEVCRQHV